MNDQLNLTTATGDEAVECLGITFPNDQARRVHFLKLLAEKLKDKERRGRSRSRSGSRRRRRRRRRSSSGSESKSPSLFREGSSGGQESLLSKAKRRPGYLMRTTLEEMSKYVTIPGLPTGETVDWHQMRASLYMTQVLLFQHPPERMGVRTHRELLTLSRAVDLLLEGHLPALGDLLCQQMKALETALKEGGWSNARHQQVIPASSASMTTAEEQDYLLRSERRQQKLVEAQVKGAKKAKP